MGYPGGGGGLTPEQIRNLAKMAKNHRIIEEMKDDVEEILIDRPQKEDEN